tara:strand:+ start:1382 stop:1645 length:264 start_codon:yes stop_codon:yes gene_type:complete
MEDNIMEPITYTSPPPVVSTRAKLTQSAKGFLDKVFERVISRKLAVWCAATYALYTGMLTSSDWVAVSLAYIGSQAVVDLASKWKGS